MIYLVNIDIKDGWYDTLKAFTHKTHAEAYLEWIIARTGDHAYISIVPLDDFWSPPTAPSGGSVFS